VVSGIGESELELPWLESSSIRGSKLLFVKTVFLNRSCQRVGVDGDSRECSKGGGVGVGGSDEAHRPMSVKE